MLLELQSMFAFWSFHLIPTKYPICIIYSKKYFPASSQGQAPGFSPKNFITATLEGEEVALLDMLDCREHRATLQKELLDQYHSTLISFCMNIPGPIKTNDSIQAVFESGVSDILKTLQKNQISILYSKKIHEKTGDELLLVVDSPAADLIKEQMTAIEETHPLGRLFDIDVLDANGRKRSRKGYRKCFLCGCQAQECASSRKHSVPELQSYIANQIEKFQKQN